MFYTRPNLPEVGIDLVDDVGGGGSCPSQFWGRTADGREVYIRYRGGHLSVSVGNSREVPGEDVLSTDIGPSFHGDMLLEQACDLTGITIRGDKPSLSEEKLREAAEEAPFMDWSGRTTYWIRDVLVSKKGAERLAQELANIFPGMQILETEFLSNPGRRVFVSRKTLEACKYGAFFGFDGDERGLARLLSGNHADLADLDRVFGHHLSMQTRWKDQILSKSAWDTLWEGKIELPEPDLRGSLKTKFATGDPAGERFMGTLLETVGRCFSNWAEYVDLHSGDSVGAPREMQWYSLDLRDWCQAAPNRFLFSGPGKDELGRCRNLGIRACRALV